MSKILEALDCLKIAGVDFYRSIETYVPEIHSDISETQYFDNTDEFYVIEQVLLEAQDLEKENIKFKRVLNIIKEKCVSMWHLMKSKTVEDYNSYLVIEGIEDTKIFELTQEEFDLLKEYSRTIETEMLK